MDPKRRSSKRLGFLCGVGVVLLSLTLVATYGRADLVQRIKQRLIDERIETNAHSMLVTGRATFRSDTFGSESFWGDNLKLHRAIAGERNGGVGPGVNPKTALAVGLKVDVDALPAAVVQALQRGEVNLDDPATTVTLLKLDSVVGVKGFFNADGSM